MRRLLPLLLLLCLLPLPVVGDNQVVYITIDHLEVNLNRQGQNPTTIISVHTELFASDLDYNPDDLEDCGLNATAATVVSANLTVSPTMVTIVEQYCESTAGTNEDYADAIYLGDFQVVVEVDAAMYNFSSIAVNYTQSFGNGTSQQGVFDFNATIAFEPRITIHNADGEFFPDNLPEDATASTTVDDYVQEIATNEVVHFTFDIGYGMDDFAEINEFVFSVDGHSYNGHDHNVTTQYSNYHHRIETLIPHYAGEQPYFVNGTSLTVLPAVSTHELGTGITPFNLTSSRYTLDTDQTVPYDGVYTFWVSIGAPSWDEDFTITTYNATMTIENGQISVDYPEPSMQVPTSTTTSSSTGASSLVTPSSDSNFAPFFFLPLVAVLVLLPRLISYRQS